MLIFEYLNKELNCEYILYIFISQQNKKSEKENETFKWPGPVLGDLCVP